MDEGYSQKAKQTSKFNHEQRKLNKLFARREAAKRAGQDELALKYSAKIHNYATMGGDQNPKNVFDSVEYDMSNRLDEKEFARMLRAGLRKVARVAGGVARKTGGAVSNWANASYERGRAMQAEIPPEKQEADTIRKDKSKSGFLRGRGPV